MAKLLHLMASPRGDRSRSLAVAAAFIEAYREANPDDDVDTLDMSSLELPPFDGPALDAKYAILHGDEPSGEQAKAWKAVEEAIEEFKSADKYVLSVPMWNFGIPYTLKHYIDVITQPTYLFNYSPEEGYTGLVTGKPALITAARGGAYPEGSDMEAFDYQLPYVKTWLQFIGFTDIRSLVVEPTLMDPDK